MLPQDKKISPCYSKFSHPMLDAPITVRIKFCKIGNLQFISHLDLQRSFHRILVRSGIPMWYTKGFNPHAKLVFGLPLSVGTESMCEFADLKIEREITPEEIKKQLNENLTDEMYVLEAYLPASKFSDIIYAGYTIEICSDKLCQSSAKDTEKLFSSAVTMMKKSKSGEKEVDITQYIKSLSAEISCGVLKIDTILYAGGEKNLNPEYIVTAIKNNLGFMGQECRCSYRIMRNAVYGANMCEFR